MGEKISLHNKWRMALRVMVLASVKIFGELDTKASAVHSEDDEFFLTWLENIQAKHGIGHATVEIETDACAGAECG